MSIIDILFCLNLRNQFSKDKSGLVHLICAQKWHKARIISFQKTSLSQFRDIDIDHNLNVTDPSSFEIVGRGRNKTSSD